MTTVRAILMHTTLGDLLMVLRQRMPTAAPEEMCSQQIRRRRSHNSSRRSRNSNRRSRSHRIKNRNNVRRKRKGVDK
jgi:hypothetical protein